MESCGSEAEVERIANSLERSPSSPSTENTNGVAAAGLAATAGLMAAAGFTAAAGLPAADITSATAGTKGKGAVS